MIETSFTLTQREFTSAVRLSGLATYFRRRTLFQVVAIYAGLTLALFIFARPDPHLVPAPIFVLGFLGACGAYLLFGAVLYWVLWPFSARRQMRSNKELRQPMHCKGDDAGWHVRIGASSSDISWDAYTKWSENTDMLLIYPNNNIFQMIPKRALSGPHDLERIRAWLSSAGVPRVAPFR